MKRGLFPEENRSVFSASENVALEKPLTFSGPQVPFLCNGEVGVDARSDPPAVALLRWTHSFVVWS